MKLLWLCNRVPGTIGEHAFGRSEDGLWIDQVFSSLRDMGLRIHVLSRGKELRGQLDSLCSYAFFREDDPAVVQPGLEAWMEGELRAFQPDVIHIWGTEFAHTLALVNACAKQDLLDRTVVSIQGLCGFIARHYTEGLPQSVCRSFTFRDFLRQDNIRQQKQAFARRGVNEAAALAQTKHVMGRTHWDRACTRILQPDAGYFHCGETLRQCFYQGSWQFDTCRRYRVFASSCDYPVKGFHYLLEAVGSLISQFPEITLAVTGKSFLSGGIRQTSYQKYLASLAEQYGLKDRIEFLGNLTADQMKQQYLMANAFVLPSTIENSPNSLGEAMLLGVPCVASDVGGVSTMLTHGAEGYIYQSTAPYMLAHYLRRILEAGEGAEEMGSKAADHARTTHDPRQNLSDLMAVYRSLSGKEK